MLSILSRDVYLTLALFMAVLVIIMINFINPISDDKQAEPPGNLIVHITWPEGNTDVDMWLSGPAEPFPVGYSNKGGVLWNLLRDDLGDYPDATPLNYENAFTRGVVPGEYTINVHCYRCPQLPIEVGVEISLNNDAGKKGKKTSSKIIVTTSIMLRKNKQERTAINFKLNEDGTVNPDSMNNVYKPLLYGKKK